MGAHASTWSRPASAPGWLDADDPRVRVVDHREILPADALPTFNSQAIETALHHVPGLAEHFVYLNDDVFLGRAARPELFFSPGGTVRGVLRRRRWGSRPARTADKPFLHAAATNRALLEEAFGVAITQVMAHSPHPHRVSVLAEVEARFPDAVGAHRALAVPRRHRRLDALARWPSTTAWSPGRRTSPTAEHAFVDLSNARIERQLRQLRARDRDFFCIGDHHEYAVDADAVDAMLAEFLADYFPVKAPWER